MKQNIFAALMVAVLCMNISSAQAQDCGQCEAVAVTGNACAGGGCGGKVKRAASVPVRATRAALGVAGGNSSAVYDGDGRVQPQTRFVNPQATVIYGARDQFSPAPLYSHSSAGAQAGFVHAWNQSQQNANSWHGGYNSWRYQQPTALVVPPTASYQSTYSWGVGQTRSTPIHHQFGRGGGSFGGDAGGYQNRPYFPWNTNQFGYYPVRANW